MATLTAPTLNALKTADPDRCRAAVMASAQGRADLLLLYAFHYELAKVPEMVSEPMIGEIRYQWWRDCVDEIYSGGAKPVRRHEISTPLSEMLIRVDMPRFWVDRLIDGRAADLSRAPFSSLDDASRYARETSGTLMQMALSVLGVDDTDAAVMAGEAWGLTGLLRGWRFYTDGMLSELSFDSVREHTQFTYDRAKANIRSLPSAGFPAISYGALIPGFIKKASQPGHDPAQDALEYGPLAKRLTLMRAALAGTI